MSFTSKHLAPSSQRLIEFIKKYNVCKKRRSAFQPAGCTQQQREWNGGGRARCPAISAFPAHIQSEEERGRCLRHQQPPRHSLETRSTDAFSLTWLPPAERELQGRARETSGPVCESIRLTMARHNPQPGKDNWCRHFFKCKFVEAKWTEGRL